MKIINTNNEYSKNLCLIFCDCLSLDHTLSIYYDKEDKRFYLQLVLHKKSFLLKIKECFQYIYKNKTIILSDIVFNKKCSSDIKSWFKGLDIKVNKIKPYNNIDKYYRQIHIEKVLDDLISFSVIIAQYHNFIKRFFVSLKYLFTNTYYYEDSWNGGFLTEEMNCIIDKIENT